MAQTILFMFPGACSRVTMTALEEAGVPYEERSVDIQAGAQRSPDYLAVNRKGKVPALLLGDTLLTENVAILRMLDEQYPSAQLLPRHDDPVERARVTSDLAWASSTLHPMVRQIRNPQRWTQSENTDGVKADGLAKLAVEAAYIATRVASSWWYGERWSIMDTYLYWAYSTAQKGGFPLADYPQLVAHAARVREQPAFQRALARERAIATRDALPVDLATL